VLDTASAADWSIQSNLQKGNAFYGDRTYTFSNVPTELLGSIWIRTANDSKSFTRSPIASFALSGAADVYVAFDNRSARPAWADASWADTGFDLTQSENATVSRAFSVYKKRFNAGTVSLGAWNNSSASMYTVIIK
jgi:hypothetical protein